MMTLGCLPVYVVTSDRGRASAVTARAFMLTHRPWPEQSSGQPDRSQAAPEKPSKHSHSPVSRLQSPLRAWITAPDGRYVRAQKTWVAQIEANVKLLFTLVDYEFLPPNRLVGSKCYSIARKPHLLEHSCSSCAVKAPDGTSPHALPAGQTRAEQSAARYNVRSVSAPHPSKHVHLGSRNTAGILTLQRGYSRAWILS